MLVASLAGCGGSSSGSSNTSSTPPTTNTPIQNVSGFYGLYEVNFVSVLDTGCDIPFDATGTVTLSGNPDGSNVTIEVFERAVRTYTGRLDANGRLAGGGSGVIPSGTSGTRFRHSYQAGIQGEVQGPPSGISGREDFLFLDGCPGQMVQLEFTGRP